MPGLTRGALPALLSLLAACSDSPGELVGAYRITMHLEDNSCGAAALPLRDGYPYTVELREEGPRGFWRVPKAPAIEGSYDAGAGAFMFSTGMTLELGQEDAGTLGCTLLREEVLRGEVSLPPEPEGDAGDAGLTPDDAGTAGGLRGEHVISFRPNPQGRCKDHPGPLSLWEHLPCAARYALDGKPTKPF
jgi:hypothetical protein